MDIRRLVSELPHPGRVTWIGVRSARRGPIVVLDEVEAIVGLGLVGDRRAAPGRRPDPGGKRHVTLIQAEHLPAIGAILGRGPVPPDLLRRNLVVEGCNLRALQGRRFTVGDVVLEGTGECHPCSRMEEALGPGGYQAMRGHGGLNARVLRGGMMRRGDELHLCDPGEGPLGRSVPAGRRVESTEHAPQDPSPVAAGRAGSALHADHDPG